MTRRLLGYVVKLPNGEWYNGKSRADKDFDGYPWTRDAKKRHVFTEYQDACRYVLMYVPENLLRIVPVFSKPKSAVVVPPLAQALAILSIDKTKPAPVVAAEGLFAVLVQHEGHKPTTFLDLDMAVTVAPFREVGTRAEVLAAVENETPAFRRMAVRILPDGAHEAALAAAREEGRREAAGRIARLVDALQNVLDGHSELTPHAIVEIEYALEEEREEAAKGAAK